MNLHLPKLRQIKSLAVFQHGRTLDVLQEQTWQDDGFEAYASTELSQNFAEDELEQAELNCVACLHDMMGECMMEQPDTCACFIQYGLTACFANNPFNKGRGKGSKGKYPIRPSIFHRR